MAKTLLRGLYGLTLATMLTLPALAQQADWDDAENKIAQADEVTDLLNGRWFEVELVIFERLGVLDFNTPETLTKTSPRRWPAALTELSEPLAASDDLFDPNAPNQAQNEQIDSPLPGEFSVDNDPRCLGYPLWPEQDPIHPSLAPPSEFGDAFNLNNGDVLVDVPIEDSTALDVTNQTDPGLDANGDPVIDLEPEVQPTPEIVPEPTEYELFLTQIAAFETHLERTSHRPLELTLIQDVKAINRQRHLRPMIHLRWRQAVPERQAGEPIYLAAPIDRLNPANAMGYARVEGFVEVTVGRYLHVAPTLWYHSDILGQTPLEIVPTINTPANVATVPASQDYMRLPEPLTNAYMELSESRRMRSGTLHYLDHPKMGVLVRVDPIQIPPELTRQLDELQNVAD